MDEGIDDFWLNNFSRLNKWSQLIKAICWRMENTWTNGCGAERQDLDPIMEEEDKSPPKGFCVFHVPMKYIGTGPSAFCSLD